ncbi:hypothetical protein SAMN05421737_10482 [Shouchella lonarensis]|uniref:Uncharacterized protein n=1 Tax=Shouchella lonarensis TaxID=1464122 RepID=A0A1G6HMQ6_9BACI|nr:hypothetical protein SAMN05421737_10482 [Shouchella lonarensis]
MLVVVLGLAAVSSEVLDPGNPGLPYDASSKGA